MVLKFFGGLNSAEIAGILGLANRTLHRQLTYARAWLFRYIRGHKSTLKIHQKGIIHRVQDHQRQGEVVEQNVRGMDRGGHAAVAYERGGDSLSLGLLEYRPGNYEKARDWCHHCLADPLSLPHRDATAQLILALCYWKMNREPEAIVAWRTASQRLQDRFPCGLVPGNNAEGFSFDWIIARECQELFAKAGHREHLPMDLGSSW